MTLEDVGELLDRRWRELITSNPACWSWEPPARPVTLYGWQQGRCAICGCSGPLVDDHDHTTALSRGWLCGRCNTLEGLGHGGVFAKYRERNPATICSVRERYWNGYTQDYAEPAEPAFSDAERWARNPMRNAGL